MVDLAFLIVGAATIAAAVLALEAREIVYGAVALGFSFLGVAGLFILLDAPFLAMFQVLVYVGAVAVLILFTVMLVRRERWLEAESGFERTLGLLAGLVLAMIMGILAFQAGLNTWYAQDAAAVSIPQIGEQLLTAYWPAFVALGLVLAASVLGALTLAKVEREA